MKTIEYIIFLSFDITFNDMFDAPAKPMFYNGNSHMVENTMGKFGQVVV